MGLFASPRSLNWEEWGGGDDRMRNFYASALPSSLKCIESVLDSRWAVKTALLNQANMESSVYPEGLQ